jgi:hypothetical protein
MHEQDRRVEPGLLRHQAFPPVCLKFVIPASHTGGRVATPAVTGQDPICPIPVTMLAS